MNDNTYLLDEQSLDKNGNRNSKEPINFKRAFRNRFGHLRAGWRMLVNLCVVAPFVIPINSIMNSIKPYIPGGTGIHSLSIILVNIILMSAFIFAAYLTLKLVDKRPFRLLGFWFSTGWFREYYIGFGIGFGTMTISLFILWLSNLMDVSMGTLNSAMFLSLSKLFILFTIAGAFEELMLRGYFLQVFIEGSNKLIAIIVLSLIFSAMHMFNPNWSVGGAVNIFLGGIMLSIAYIKTRSLWLPIGLHMAWNWTQGPLWGMKVSGYTIENSFLVSSPQGPKLLSGGEFGAEGSLITSVVVILVSWYMWHADWIKPSDANASIWRKYPSGYGIEPLDSRRERTIS